MEGLHHAPLLLELLLVLLLLNIFQLLRNHQFLLSAGVSEGRVVHKGILRVRQPVLAEGSTSHLLLRTAPSLLRFAGSSHRCLRLWSSQYFELRLVGQAVLDEVASYLKAVAAGDVGFLIAELVLSVLLHFVQVAPQRLQVGFSVHKRVDIANLQEVGGD